MSRLTITLLIVLVACSSSCYGGLLDGLLGGITGGSGGSNGTSGASRSGGSLSGLTDSITKLTKVLDSLLKQSKPALEQISGDCLQTILDNYTKVLQASTSVPDDVVRRVVKVIKELFGTLGAVGV